MKGVKNMESNAAKKSSSKRNDATKLVLASLFVALAAVLKFFEISFTQDFRFNLCPMIWIVSGVILGPYWGFGVGAVSDILNYFIGGGGAFVPGFTLSTALTAAIPGFIYYRERLKAQKAKSESKYILYNVLLFAGVFAAVFAAVIGLGIIRVENGSIMIRDSQISTGYVIAGAAMFLLSSVLMTVMLRRNSRNTSGLSTAKMLFVVALTEFLCSFLINSLLLYFMYGALTVVTGFLRLFRVLFTIPLFTFFTLLIVNLVEKTKIIQFRTDSKVN